MAQDDRLDALAIAVAYWVEQMAQDASRKMNDRREQLLDQELRDFTDHVQASISRLTMGHEVGLGVGRIVGKWGSWI